jgi:hypothetical protein
MTSDLSFHEKLHQFHEDVKLAYYQSAILGEERLWGLNCMIFGFQLNLPALPFRESLIYELYSLFYYQYAVPQYIVATAGRQKTKSVNISLCNL